MGRVKARHARWPHFSSHGVMVSMLAGLGTVGGVRYKRKFEWTWPADTSGSRESGTGFSKSAGAGLRGGSVWLDGAMEWMGLMYER